MATIIEKIELYFGNTCPICGSKNTTQIADHCTSGANEYICNNCGTRFAN